jgi:mxaJ protein
MARSAYIPGTILLLAALAGSPSRTAMAQPPSITPSPPATDTVLRVCANPDDLPFSNARKEGFENKLADLAAHDLGRRVVYTWTTRQGGVWNALSSAKCDLVIDARSSVGHVLRTAPYYRSTYVFVYRRRSPFQVRSFDDPVLRRMRIGVQVVGDDYRSAPPVQMLSKRGIIDNVIGYPAPGARNPSSVPSRIIDAVARGDLDVAVVRGPPAGYFARGQIVPLTIVPVAPRSDSPSRRLAFDVSMGVRPGDTTLRDLLDDVIQRHTADIDRILRDYDVPLAERPEPSRRRANGHG